MCTFVGHRSVSIRVPLTADSPPTSHQPNSPAVCNLTPLNAAGVNPSTASFKSCVEIAGPKPPSVDTEKIVHRI